MQGYGCWLMCAGIRCWVKGKVLDYGCWVKGSWLRVLG